MSSVKTFQGVIDRYNGVTVDSRDEPCAIDQFSPQLINSIVKWDEEQKRCIWFKVHIKDAAWVPALANKRAVRAIYNIGPGESLRDKFKEINIMTAHNQYIFENLQDVLKMSLN